MAFTLSSLIKETNNEHAGIKIINEKEVDCFARITTVRNNKCIFPESKHYIT
jgi:hypothetical protein